MKHPSSPAPAALVQRQLDAYNARDVDVLLATYAADARQFEHPDKLLDTGHVEMRPRFLARFEEPNLHARLLHRTVVGSTVIDHELITRTVPEGPGTLELVAIYDIRAGLIAEARFITGTKTLAARS
jgi:hypothetical protein